MEASPKTRIDSFLKQEHIALAGYSHNTRKFGHVVYKTLKDKGYVIHPINPGGGTAPGGETVHKTMETLPDTVNALLIITKPPVTARRHPTLPCPKY